jgi:hypothetical protein
MEANIASENLVHPSVLTQTLRFPANVVPFQHALLPNDRSPQPDPNMDGNRANAKHGTL